MQSITNLFAFYFGLCFGSFANVAIYRLPRGESVVAPPSHCPSCSKRLSGADLIPVVSWLLLRGRCRYCGVRISRRYPLIEVACATLFVGMAVYAGSEPAVVPLCLLAFVLLCVSCIDLDTCEIPDGLLIFGAAVGTLWVALSHFFTLGAPVWYDSLLGAAAGALPLFVIDRLTILLYKKDGFGYGDIKLMAMAGIFLGWRLTLTALLFAVVAGGAFGVVLLCTRRKGRGAYMPFAPFLAVGVLSSLWFGEKFIALLFPV